MPSNDTGLWESDRGVLLVIFSIHSGSDMNTISKQVPETSDITLN